MNIEPMWIGILSFASVFFLIIGLAAVARLIRHPVDSRLERLRPNAPAASTNMMYTEVNQQSIVANLGQRVAPTDPFKRSMIKLRLAMAGYYSEASLYNYWGIKMVTTFIPPLVVFMLLTMRHLPAAYTVMPVLAAMGIGLLLPDVFLFLRKRSRQDEIFKGLPDALDLLLVCVEAGLGLDAAMQKVCDELGLGCRILIEELQLTCTAIRFGQDRNEALHDLGERTGVLDLKSLVAVLVQADRFGVSIGQALRVHADDMRTRRRQRAEEMAAKTTVKLIFPLVLFIFPAIFVVLGGPAVIRIMENFMNR
jgi:tight adherence protein C